MFTKDRLAICDSGDWGGLISDENARLIAAAPEMYAFLVKLAAEKFEEDGDDMEDGYVKAVVAARGLLVKIDEAPHA